MIPLLYQLSYAAIACFSRQEKIRESRGFVKRRLRIKQKEDTPGLQNH